jgi:hypothetical protein
MPQDVNNAIGDRGEAIFASIMTKFHGSMPLFRRPVFLGEKWPFVDYLCELIGPWKAVRPFFVVQVKATMRGYTRADGRLRVAISAERAKALQSFRVPAYLVGVDAIDEKVFIVGAAGHVASLSSMHTGVELDTSGRRQLWEDVRRFWAQIPRRTNWTTLKEPKWH